MPPCDYQRWIRSAAWWPFQGPRVIVLRPSDSLPILVDRLRRPLARSYAGRIVSPGSVDSPSRMHCIGRSCAAGTSARLKRPVYFVPTAPCLCPFSRGRSRRPAIRHGTRLLATGWTFPYEILNRPVSVEDSDSRVIGVAGRTGCSRSTGRGAVPPGLVDPAAPAGKSRAGDLFRRSETRSVKATGQIHYRTSDPRRRISEPLASHATRCRQRGRRFFHLERSPKTLITRPRGAHACETLSGLSITGRASGSARLSC